MEILVCSKYDSISASSRVRLLQYFSYLEEKGLKLKWSPLLDNHYLHLIFSQQKPSWRYIFSRYCKRARLLLASKKYDAIWLEAELFPYIPSWVEKIFYHFCKTPIVVNYDDAIFHNYDLHPNKITKWILKNKIKQVMKHAHTVIVGNQYLKEYAQKSHAKRIVEIPTVVDLEAYQVLNETTNKEKIHIGWIGTPTTLQYLKLLTPVFQKLAKKIPIKILLMGVDNFFIPEVEVMCFPWSKETEVFFLQSLDIGVMPLRDTAWERGKCGYKLIQYMACGKPVVGTPIGINREIIVHTCNGFWATTDDEWLYALEQLSRDAKLRAQMGEIGRSKVEEQYSLQATAETLLAALRASIK